MKVKYQNANPRRGAQSYYIKFQDKERETTNVVLVDAGEGVDVSEDLDDDEYLSAILLTHAHGDHYHSLHKNLKHGAPILASPDTSKSLKTVYTDAKDHSFDEVNDGQSEEVFEQLKPITDWENLVGEDVKTKPVPAGHTPGASGFLIRFNDGNDRQNILVTGDFTFEKSAGNPGLPKEYPFEIGALFLNASTRRENELEDALGKVLGYAERGNEVVVTTSAANGVKFSYVLGKILDRVGETTTVKTIGSTAKLYETLDYDVPNVASVVKYDDASDIIAPGTVCVCAPENPRAGSSSNFLRALDEEDGVVIKLGGKEAVDTEKRSFSYTYTSHPTEEDLNELVDSVVPRNVIVEHDIHERYRDGLSDAFVWATPNQNEHTLYDGGSYGEGWVDPPWMRDTDRIREIIEAKDRAKGDELPPVKNKGSSLEEEGVEIAKVFEARSEVGVKTKRETVRETEETRLETEMEEVFKNVKKEMKEFSTVAEAARDEIEKAVSAVEVGETVRARVVDTGDGILLKLQETGDRELEHGEEVELQMV